MITALLALIAFLLLIQTAGWLRVKRGIGIAIKSFLALVAIFGAGLYALYRVEQWQQTERERERQQQEDLDRAAAAYVAEQQAAARAAEEEHRKAAERGRDLDA